MSAFLLSPHRKRPSSECARGTKSAALDIPDQGRRKGVCVNVIGDLAFASGVSVQSWVSRIDEDAAECRERAFDLWLSCHTQQEIAILPTKQTYRRAYVPRIATSLFGISRV